MSHQDSVASGSQPLTDASGNSGTTRRGDGPAHRPDRISGEQHLVGKQATLLSEEQWGGSERASPRAAPAESSRGSQKGLEGFRGERTADNQTPSVKGVQDKGTESSEGFGRVSAIAGASTQTALPLQVRLPLCDSPLLCNNCSADKP